MLQVGEIYEMEYHLRGYNGQRCGKVYRKFRILREDEENYYVQTGPIVETPIRKEDIEY